MISPSQTKVVASHFRSSPRFGRTTTLINAKTGEKLVEVMGACSRKEAYASYKETLRPDFEADLIAQNYPTWAIANNCD